MTDQVTIGRVPVRAVSDIRMGGSREYMFPQVPEERWHPWRHYLNERGNLSITIGTFVVRSEGKTILIDTGLGEKPRENFPPRPPQLMHNLTAAGVRPEDVDVVITTHLHVDHVGWNTVRRDPQRPGQDDAWVPTFPRARYLVARPDWDHFSQPEQVAALPYMADSVLPVHAAGQLDLVEGEQRVTGEITLIPAPGHTPGHMCVAIVSAGERAVIIGDLAHHPVQLTELEWSVVFDLNPKLAVETRARMVERMEAEGAVVIGGHFPFPGFGRLVRLGERRLWQALG